MITPFGRPDSNLLQYEADHEGNHKEGKNCQADFDING
jgi:hypothetical protein